MNPSKSKTTVADYLVMSISPALIMLLVGSLSFFLVEVFFRGPAVNGVRWVMFWFVMAVVLVSRIAIENTSGQAAVYGLALAIATWLYLASIHPAFILGMALLGIVWWCAHKLTWDCTLIDEDDDASGKGLLQTIDFKKDLLPSKQPVATVKKTNSSKKKPPSHPPGLSVVYFSLAALPIFGLGQMLLPKTDLAARRLGFIFLFVYVSAALGLLLTTSFLGLRRYLRQRHLQMPGIIAFGWIRFGVGIALFVLLGALLLPSPGVEETWQKLRHQMDYRVRQASDYALRFNPHGKGNGRAGNETEKSGSKENSSANSQPKDGQGPNSASNGQTQSQDTPSLQPITQRPAQSYNWMKIVFFVILVALAGRWIFRKRSLLLQIAQSVIATIKKFFNDLFGIFSRHTGTQARIEKKEAKKNLFASYRNPFLLGKDSGWTFEELVLYSYEAVQAWSQEAGMKPRPQQTAREFCAELGSHFPEISSEVSQLSYFYYHAAYGMSPPIDYDLEPIKKLWRFLYGE